MMIKRKNNSTTSQGRKTTINGNFNLRVPKVPLRVSQSKNKRMGLLLSEKSSREVAKLFGVNKSTIGDWRKKLKVLSKERPSIWKELAFSSTSHKLAKKYYDRGGNKLRLELNISGDAVEGLLVALAVYGYLPFSREEYISRVALNKINRPRKIMPKKEVISELMEQFGVKKIYATKIVEKIMPNKSLGAV